MKVLILLSFILNLDTNFGFTSEEIKKCKTAEQVNYLNQTEKDVIYYTNLIRLSPKKFERTILSKYLKENPEYSRSYSKSLIKELKNTSPKPLLSPTKTLYKFAKHHAQTTGKRGKVGHRSIRGKGFSKRSKPLLKTYEIVGENIHYGANDALEIVIDLLVDDGIKDKGHRENILFSEFIYCSVSLQPHKKYTYNCVIDFAGKMK